MAETSIKRKNKVEYSRLEKKYFKYVYLFLLPTVVIFAMFYVQPIITMGLTSLTKWNGFAAPEFIGLKNYIRIITNSSSAASLKNLVLWSIIAMTIHNGFGVLVAFILFNKPKGWKVTRAVFMIPNIISAAAWSLIYRFIFNDQVGILNGIIRFFNPDFHAQWFFQSPYAFWAVTLTWLFYAVIVTLIVLNDLNAIDTSLLEAAALDGATGWQIIRYLELPMCRISIGTGMLCSITSRISMYEAIALTTSGGPGDDTMSFSVLLVRAISDYNYGFANAIGVVMFVFGLIVLWFINRLFRMNDSVY